jgi:hypothetical protein
MRTLVKRLLLLAVLVLMVGGVVLGPTTDVQAQSNPPTTDEPLCFYYEIIPTSDFLIYTRQELVNYTASSMSIPVVPGELFSGYQLLPVGISMSLHDSVGSFGSGPFPHSVVASIFPDGTYNWWGTGTGTIRRVMGAEAQACFGSVIPDGRLNRFDVAAPVIIYPDGSGGVDFYVLDENGDGQMVLHVTAEQIAAIASPPAANTLIAEGAGIAFYRLATGEFQVNMGGYVVIFDTLTTTANAYNP